MARCGVVPEVQSALRARHDEEGWREVTEVLECWQTQQAQASLEAESQQIANTISRTVLGRTAGGGA